MLERRPGISQHPIRLELRVTCLHTATCGQRPSTTIGPEVLRLVGHTTKSLRGCGESHAWAIVRALGPVHNRDESNVRSAPPPPPRHLLLSLPRACSLSRNDRQEGR